MDSLLHIKTFVAVARLKGFSEAARQLKITPSVVAKRIAQLEHELGTRLFERTTRTVKLTEAGEKLLARAGVLVANFEELLQSVERDESKPAGHIRIMAPTTLTTLYLNQVFADFLQQHDQITMEVAMVDASTNPAEQGFDIGISGRSASYEGVVDIPLCPVNLVICASPAYLKRRGSPTHPRELTEHDCLMFKPSGPSWQFQSSRGLISIEMKARLLADDNATLLRAAINGTGIAALPMYIAREALATGVLQQVLEQFPPQQMWFKVYVPRRRRGVARVEALIEFLAGRLASEEWMRDVALP
jgi:DNA-binding transcriptional LysR family regulator